MAEPTRRSQELLAETWGLGRDLPADLTSRLLLLPQASRSDPTAPWQPQSESANRRAHGSGRSEQRAAAPGPWAHLCDIAAQTRTPNAAGADATEVRSDRLAKPGEVGATSNSGPRGDPSPRPRSQRAATGFAWQALPCEHPDSQTRSCAGMRWSVPEVGTNLGTNSLEGEFRRKQRAGNNGGQGRD